MSGLFIFEGVEGSGKTTLIDSVHLALAKKNFTSIKTREPGGTNLGKKIRELLLESNAECTNISPLAELLLFCADRSQHITEILKPSLAQKNFILCDRFIYSTIAYQVYGRGLDAKLIESLNKIVLENFKPNGVILLDIDPALSFKRVAIRGAKDRFENEDQIFHQKIRNGYLEIAKANRDLFIVLDANQSTEELTKLTLKFISERANVG